MKREFVFGGLIALALSVGAAAQTAYPPSQDKDKDKDNKDTVTVTGCLVPGAGGPVGTSGTTATPPVSPGFKLINATKDGASAATTTAGTSGTTAPAPAADAGKSFTLVGGDQADLQKWVNSKVEIKGTIESSAAMPTTTADTPDKAPAPRLRITSVKQIASTCSGQQ